jgi:hypothetical protein
MRIPDFTVTSFAGLNTFIKDRKTLKPGIATDVLNWVTGKYGGPYRIAPRIAPSA